MPQVAVNIRAVEGKFRAATSFGVTCGFSNVLLPSDPAGSQRQLQEFRLSGLARHAGICYGHDRSVGETERRAAPVVKGETLGQYSSNGGVR